MFDVISVGSATEDVFVYIPQKFATHDACVFHPGTKVDIKEMDYFTGGGATNTAVAFSRLGFRTSVLCVVGNDESGNSVIKNLKDEKVNTSFVKKIPGKTPYSVILTGFGRDRIVLCYSNMTASINKAKTNFSKLKAKWFYISSLHSKPVLLKKIVAHAKSTGTRIAFNPGNEELSLGFEGLKKAVKKVEILLLNKEEALKLTGSGDIHRNLKKLSEIATIVVITDGNAGAHATNGVYAYSVGIFDVPRVDVTGAGDAFGSGFTAAIMKGKSIEEALLYGGANASSVIQSLGTKNILLTEKALQKFLKTHKLAVKKQKL